MKTFERMCALIADRAQIIFCDAVPEDVPGAYQVQSRRDRLKRTKLQTIETTGKGPGIFRCVTDLTKEFQPTLKTGDLEPLIPYEPMVLEAGLKVVRRNVPDGEFLFVVNTSGKRIDRWVTLDQPAAKGVVLMDPLSGKSGLACANFGISSTHDNQRQSKVYLQLEPAQSVILRIFDAQEMLKNVPPWKYFSPIGPAVELKGPWKVGFIEGGPVLPPATTVQRLSPWTEFAGDDAQSFAGTARYTIRFDGPATPAPHYSLNLGKVRCSARLRLNGQALGTLFMEPFRVPIETLKTTDNVLEIEVTGTSANRIRDLDLKKVPWKIFYDANIVTKDYQPFDASGWPLSEQGLLGPVFLQPEIEQHVSVDQ